MKKQRHRRGLVAVLAAGIIAVLAIGATSASATSVTGQPVAFKAFVDNGFDGVIVGVNGGVVNARCVDQRLALVLAGTASNGLAKSNYNDEQQNESTFSADDLDSGEVIPLNISGGLGIGSQVIGHAEFANGQNTRTMTVNYSTEDEGDFFGDADCAVWGSAIKGIY